MLKAMLAAKSTIATVQWSIWGYARMLLAGYRAMTAAAKRRVGGVLLPNAGPIPCVWL